MTFDLLQPGWRERDATVGSIRLHVVEAGPKSGAAVILLHGFPEFWWGWRHQIGPLAAAGYRVIVPDMRGYNLSDAPVGTAAYRADRISDDIAGLDDALGILQFSLVGHDWGGLVAWRLASRAAQRIDRLVIMDAPHPEVFADFMLRHPSQVLRSAYAGWFQLPLVPEAVLSAFDFAALKRALRASASDGVFTEAVLRRYQEAWAQPGSLTAMLNYYRAMRMPGAGTIGRISVPTLILWGGRDSFLNTGLAHVSEKMVDVATTTIFDDATHWLHLEQPERVAEELLRFLGKYADKVQKET